MVALGDQGVATKYLAEYQTFEFPFNALSITLLWFYGFQLFRLQFCDPPFIFQQTSDDKDDDGGDVGFLSQASLSESVTSNQFTNSIPKYSLYMLPIYQYQYTNIPICQYQYQYTNSIPIYSLYMLASPAKQAWVQQMVNEAELGDAACPPGPQMDCKKYLKKYL